MRGLKRRLGKLEAARAAEGRPSVGQEVAHILTRRAFEPPSSSSDEELASSEVGRVILRRRRIAAEFTA